MSQHYALSPYALTCALLNIARKDLLKDLRKNSSWGITIN